MKTCFKCGIEKDFSEFYKHVAMKDGLLGKCKECAKSDVKKNRESKPDQYKRYEQMRFQTQPHRRERASEYRKTEDGKIALKVARKLWLSRNPEKRAAHVILGNAVRDGRIVKPDICSRCGEKPRLSRHLHAHHHDYAKPLDVEWVCIWCHAKHHWPENEYRI